MEGVSIGKEPILRLRSKGAVRFLLLSCLIIIMGFVFISYIITKFCYFCYLEQFKRKTFVKVRTHHDFSLIKTVIFNHEEFSVANINSK